MTIPINLVCIGKDSKLKPTTIPFPPKTNTPSIYEKSEPLYRNTDEYHKTLLITHTTDELDLHNIKYGNPNVSYQDPREIIRHCNFKTDNTKRINHALKRINSVRYSNTEISELDSFKLLTSDNLYKCIYNEDWYILIFENNNIYGEYLSIDKRAIDEYNIAVDEIEKEFNNKVKTKKL